MEFEVDCDAGSRFGAGRRGGETGQITGRGSMRSKGRMFLSAAARNDVAFAHPR